MKDSKIMRMMKGLSKLPAHFQQAFQASDSLHWLSMHTVTATSRELDHSCHMCERGEDGGVIR